MVSFRSDLSIKVLVHFLLRKQELWILLLASISSFTYLDIFPSIFGLSSSVFMNTVPVSWVCCINRFLFLLFTWGLEKQMLQS